MAVVKTINKDPKKQMSNRMTSNAHIFNALNYITRKDKTTPELTYCNLTNSSLPKYFYNFPYFTGFPANPLVK